MSNSAEDRPLTPLHSVSVAGAVLDEGGRFLVIRRADNGRWELPGGVLEIAETPEDGVCREVWEETGIHVEVDHLTGVYKNTTRGVLAQLGIGEGAFTTEQYTDAVIAHLSA